MNEELLQVKVALLQVGDQIRVELRMYIIIEVEDDYIILRNSFSYRDYKVDKKHIMIYEYKHTVSHYSLTIHPSNLIRYEG